MLTMSKRWKKWGLCLLAALTLPAILPFPAQAADQIDPNQDVTLTLIYKDDSTPLVGADFDLYHVADVSADCEFTLTGDFTDYPVDLDDIENLDNTSWRNLALTLTGYAQRDQLTPLDSGETDELGLLEFPDQLTSLKPGLYLVTGDKHTQGGKVYAAEPFVAWLPDMNEVFDEWCYDVTAMPKSESKPGDSEPGTVERKVLKVWNDTNYTHKRPKSVTVQLLQDGNVYETVTLNAETNWRYTWTDLSDEYTWNVVEQTPSGYTVVVGREGITFVVTNTYVPTPPGGDDDDDGGGGGGSKDPGGGGGSGGPGSPTPVTDETIVIEEPDVPLATLPQTGQLWWPVPLMIAAGLLFLLAGCLLRRGNADEDE